MVISVVVGGAFSVVLVGIAASVLRYHLNDVDRVLSASTAYLLTSVLVVAVFVVTLGLSQLGTSKDSSALQVGISTAAAATTTTVFSPGGPRRRRPAVPPAVLPG